MKMLHVSLELQGEQVPAGTIQISNTAEAVFRYDSSYLNRPHILPISLSLPLQEEPFDAAATARFFEGLLPEGFTRRSVAQWLHASESDYLTILHALGRECLGAIRIYTDDEAAEACYEELTPDEVQALAGEGAVHSSELVVESHLSLAGASGKVGLYRNPASGKWYLPKGTAPSTHIVKQSHVRLGGIVVNEQLALLTAKKCGIPVPDTFIINVGKGSDGEILLASERYDRTFTGAFHTVNGLPVPLRLHQEDFAQALGIPAAEKYEAPGQNHMGQMFRLLSRYSANPIADQLYLWDLLCFNVLIGNTDGHIKNSSLLYSRDMHVLRLAPAYDLISTAVYPSCTRNLAFAVGGSRSLDSITRDSFGLAADEIGLGKKMALKHLDTMCSRFEAALAESAEELEAAGLPGVKEMQSAILQSGGYSQLA